jgi:class 3 adenylate cyclase/regulation of enolase protein 1 (concanavalin A-like superfamily)/energy-coupling factor transporter ATP-binding protein EcfA2
MKCPKCNYENRNGVKFCENCGEKMPSICPECGAEVGPNARFCGECGAKLSEPSTGKAEISIPKLESMQDKIYIPEPLRRKMNLAEQEIQGENRLVTALFADISGFTPLSNQHSTEKVVNIVNDCFKLIVDTVFRYEGDPNRFVGDNVLAFFGAPIAHENDPERAIMAALEIRDKVKELSLDVSIGINTGMMYFGTIGTSEHHEVSAYGPDINLAKRLQEIAEPGQILVGSGTYRLTKRAFDFQQTPSLNLKGIDKLVTAYEAVKIKDHPEKLRGIEGLQSRMIGREREFTELRDAVDTWLSGQGQMVSIIGEAGIGKSRLVKEIKGLLNDKACIWLEGRCISIGQPISYWPFIDVFRTLFNLKEDDNEKEIAGKVRDGITELFPNRADDILPFIGHLMSIQFGDDLDSKLDGYGSEQIRYQTMVRLRDIFATIARSKPLLLILEDLHWADDLSIDLISLLMDELVTSQMFLLCVYRPEQDHKCWKLSRMAQRKCFESYTELQLRKLNRTQSYEMVQSLLAIDDLPDRVRDMILAKSEGNPFFIEEVIRSLMERELVYKDGDRWTAKSGIEHIDVPDTIHGVIMERIDRLETETKYVLQCASVIGRLFRYRLLDHLMSHERKLDEYLDELEGKELVLEERAMPELEYTFKHALTQEATYQTILEQRRRQFHRQVAEGIERLYQDRIEEFYEELAYHWERSDDQEKMLEYLIKAGEKAAGNYLNDVAIGYYTRAIQLAEGLGISGDRLGEIYEKRGGVYQSISFLEECVSDATEAARLYTQRTRRASMYARISLLYYGIIAHGQASDEGTLYARKAIEEIDPTDRSREAIMAYLYAGWALLREPEECGLMLNKARAISEEEGYKDLLAYLHTQMWYLCRQVSGAGEQARLEQEKILYYLPHLKHDLPAYAMICNLLAWWNESENISLAEEALEAAAKSGWNWSTVASAEQLGPYYLHQGETERAIEIFKQGWQAGVRSRQIHWTMGAITRDLMHLYVSTRQSSKLHEMMLQIVDSTFVMHGKPIVYPIMRQRWNNLVEDTYEFLNTIAPEVYHQLKQSLESRLSEAKTDSERFFYLGQVMLPALLDGHQEDAENLARELMKLKPEAGKFAQRVSQRLEYAVELLNYQKDQRPAMVRKLINSLDSFENLQEALAALTWVLPKGIIAQAIDWNHAQRLTMDYVQGHIKHIFHWLSPVWMQVGHIFRRYNREEDLRGILDQLQQNEPDAMKKYELIQLLLEPVELKEPGSLELMEQFTQDPMSAGWEWVNPMGTGSYSTEKDGLQITALHDIQWENLVVPRMLRYISGDFIAETKIFDGDNGKKSGGLLVWKDKANYIRFEAPSGNLEGDIVYYWANSAGKPIDAGVHPFEAKEAWLRLERKGDRFVGYVSSDGENWYRCGQVDVPMKDPIQLGILACCPRGPTTSTRFEYFKIYRPDRQSDS